MTVLDAADAGSAAPRGGGHTTPWLRAARVTWVAVGLLTLSLSVAAFIELLDAGVAQARFDQGPFALQPGLFRAIVELGVLSEGFITAGEVTIRLAGMILFGGAAGVIVWRRANDWLRLFLSATLLLVGASLFAPLRVLVRRDDTWKPLVDLVGVLAPSDVTFWRSLAGIMLLLLLCLFPDGRLVPRSSGIVVGALAVQALLWTAFPDSFLAADDWPSWARTAWAVALPLGGLLAQVWRYWRVSDPLQRRQTRLVVLALATVIATVVLLATIRPELGSGVSDLVVATPRLRTLYDLQLMLLLALALFLFPVSIVVSVVRYRLLDVDIVISRTLLYGSLAVFIGAVYVVVVVVLGGLLGTSGPSPVLAILTFAAVAVAVDPVRHRLERAANRLVYGHRATPYEVMAGLAHRMAGALSVDEVLPRMAEISTRGVGGRFGRVRLFLGPNEERVVTWPPDRPAEHFDRVVPVRFRGELVGELAVAKGPGDPFTATDSKLLDALGSQAGPALENVALTVRLLNSIDQIRATAEELERSRRRILGARARARRGLAAAIHDRVERELISAQDALTRARRATDDGAAVTAALEETEDHTERALASLRQLARGVFPPILAERGLVAALAAHVDDPRQDATLVAQEGLAERRFQLEAEACAYFCVVLAVQAMHGTARIELAAAAGGLQFEVSGPGHVTTEDLQLVEDQLAALGGSLDVVRDAENTALTGTLPAT